MRRVKLLQMTMLTLILPALQSCDDGDGYSLGDIARDWATVRVTGGNTYILNTDHWGSLQPAATAIPGYKPIDGQRMIIYFNPLYNNYEGYDHGVKVECNYDVLTKQIKNLTADDEAEMGNNSVLVYKDMMWIGGGYLDIIFRQCLPAKEKHRFSLIRDMRNMAKDGGDGYIHLEYRYSTHGGVTRRCLNGTVSFNLNSLDLIGEKDIKVKLNSVENGEVEMVLDIEEQPISEGAENIELSNEAQVM